MIKPWYDVYFLIGLYYNKLWYYVHSHMFSKIQQMSGFCPTEEETALMHKYSTTNTLRLMEWQ